MKQLLTLILILLTIIINADAQCTINYSYTGQSIDTLIFTNLSTVSNAHYYWNFGDGAASNETNPIHIFPATGKYLVTLYGRDTISNCHMYFESWISVTKPSIDSCQAFITDSIVTYMGEDYLVITDSSFNCGGYQAYIGGGPAPGVSLGNWIWLGGGWSSALFVSRIGYYTNDSVNGGVIHQEYFKTRPYKYFSFINYDSCSANFEYHVDYQATGAMVSFTAMNQNAISYQWQVIGFGNPIYTTTSTATQFYPYYGRRYMYWLVALVTQDLTGCIDTITQELLIKNPNYIPQPNCATLLQPQSQTVSVGSNVIFIISTANNVPKQWQEDAGLGYVNLTNAGPYSGVNTDTLIVSTVQLTMNNYHYRCIISNDSAGCHNTTLPAILTIHPIGIDEVELQDIRISPNPAYDNLAFSFPRNLTQADIKIFNLIGELKTNSILTGKIFNLDISFLSDGVYILEIATENNIWRQKFIKQQNIR